MKRIRIIYCNECGKTLTEQELQVYSLQWQYSGDMYCIAHEKREQFREQYPKYRIITFTSYNIAAYGKVKRFYAVGEIKENGYQRISAWEDKKSVAVNELQAMINGERK